MTRTVATVFLTAAWTALFATVDVRAIAFGAVVAFVIVWFTGFLERTDPSDPRTRWLPRPVGIVRLAFSFLGELLKSAFGVAREAWRPTLRIRPGSIAVRLDVRTDVEITVLASLISLTPGTLSLDVSSDHQWLYVHGLIIEGNGDDIRRTIASQLQRPTERAFRILDESQRAARSDARDGS
jgi:multicomponent Na+:H+ antiporter subunit E